MANAFALLSCVLTYDCSSQSTFISMFLLGIAQLMEGGMIIDRERCPGHFNTYDSFTEACTADNLRKYVALLSSGCTAETSRARLMWIGYW
jgi:hypothetical protein